MATILALVYNPEYGIRAIRARQLLQEAAEVHKVIFVYRKSNNAIDYFRYLNALFKHKPTVVFCMDVGIGPYYALKTYTKVTGRRPYVIQETADLVAELMELFDLSTSFIRKKVARLE